MTGLSTLVVIDHKRGGKAATKGVRPVVKLLDENGQEVRVHGSEHTVSIAFQVGSIISVVDGQQVGVGDVLARFCAVVPPPESVTLTTGTKCPLPSFT